MSSSNFLVRFVSRSAATALWIGVAFAIFVAFYLKDMPSTQDLLPSDRPVQLQYADGTPLLITEAKVLRAQEMPPHLIQAVIAIEDRRFYNHWGIDPRGIARAIRDNWRGESLSGGSTITQQLAKNLFLSSERTMGRKVREALLALWLEMRYSKDEILTFYLNRVYFGAGAYGVSAAAKRYFGVDVERLTLPQAALLAGLLKAPSRYSPTNDLEAAQQRTTLVLDAMQQMAFITPAQYKTSVRQITTKKAVSPVAGDWAHTGYFADYVTQQAKAILALQGVELSKDIVVRTTLQRGVQQAAATAFASLTERSVSPDTQAALVAMQPNGAVVAMLGGRSYNSSRFNRAVDAKRQPGSTFKTFVYGAAFEHGATPDDLIEDTPININGFSPKNYDGQFVGTLSLRDAFAQSRNIPAVSLASQVGVPQVRDVAMRFGVVSPLENHLALALGTSEVTVLELTNAYASFAQNCRVPTPYAIVDIIDKSSNKTLYQHEDTPSTAAAVEPVVCNRLKDILHAVVREGTGQKAALPAVDVMGKTGTSSQQRDAWFVGVTPQLIAGVWLGRDDNTPMGTGGTGGGLAAQLWKQFASKALPRMTYQQPAPTDVVPPDEPLPQFDDILAEIVRTQ